MEKLKKNTFEEIFLDNGDVNDYISKIYEGISSDDYEEQAFIYLKLIIKKYNLFLEKFAVKYGKIEDLNNNYSLKKSIQTIKNKMDFIFDKFDKFKTNEGLFNNIEAEIYTDSLEKQISEILELIESLD